MTKPYVIRTFCSLLFLCLAGVGFGQNQTVTTFVDGNPIGVDLRTAVANAGAGDTIFFSPVTNGIPQNLTAGEILIDKALVFIGNDSTQTIVGGGNSRIFRIANADSVIFSGVSLRNSSDSIGAALWANQTNIIIQQSSFSANVADSAGGAIFFEGVDNFLDIDSSSFSTNSALGNQATLGGGAIYMNGGELIASNSFFGANLASGISGSGGAIFLSAGASSDISDCSFSSNSASRAGGAIEDNSGASSLQVLTDNVFNGNITGANPGNGGAIHITGPGNMDVDGGSFNANTASREGGALWNGSGIMKVIGVTFTANTATGDAADDGGGALFNNGGSVFISGGSEFIENTATGISGSGGAIFNHTNGALSISNAVISKNTASRAGGGIEDNSGASTTISLNIVTLDSNRTESNPGNGGGLHITGPGNATITGGTVRGNFASAEGGGLWNGAGTMTVSNVNIIGNTANGAGADQGGGGIYNLSGVLNVENSTVLRDNVASGTAGSGGAILNDVNGTLNVNNVSFFDNTAVRAGGAIEDVSGASTLASITNSTFTSNRAEAAPGNGGAIHITGAGDMNVFDSEFTLNYASAEGGALWNGNGIMNIRRTIISNNQAMGAGADQGGGGIYILGGSVDIRDNTLIENNEALGTAGSGGGILVDLGAQLAVANSIIRGNSASRAGGGIEDNSRDASVIFLDKVSLENNTTGAAPGNGGGLHITGPGFVTITDGNVTANTATAEGGGLWNGAGKMVINNTRIDNNSAAGDLSDQGGGGIYNLSGTVEINGATIRANQATGAAGSGGGILNDAGAILSISNTQIIANTAVRAGGGLEDNSGASSLVTILNSVLDSNVTSMSPGNGGAVHITGDGNLNITGGFVRNNRASAEGGGLWNGAGTMNVNRVIFAKNIAEGVGADQGGGALYNLSGTLNVNKSIFTENRATGTAGSGGAILNDVNATLTVDSSDFVANRSNRAGGAIEDNSLDATTVIITSSNFTGNSTGSAPGNGGAIHITGAGNMDITGGSYRNNVASREGGAIWNGSGIMNVVGISAVSNSANGAEEHDGGGALFNNGGTLNLSLSSLINNSALTANGSGGAVNNNNGTMTITLSTISGNSSNNYGAGVYNKGSMSIVSSTITKNATTLAGGGLVQNDGLSTINLSNTILAANEAMGTAPDVHILAGAITSDGYNLVGLDAGGAITAAMGDSIGTAGNIVDPKLAPLANNGGAGFTHLPICGSPAIDSGDPSITGTDQRGLAVFGPQRDKGAVELQDDCDPTSISSPNKAETSAVIYPNPLVGTQLNIAVDNAANATAYKVIELASGKTINQGALVTGVNTINLNNLVNGAYMVQVIYDNKVENHRFIK